MRFLIIIDRKDKINYAQAFEYELEDYNYFPDDFGYPYWFNDRKEAVDFILDKIKPELISSDINNINQIRAKYLQ